jgi:hypothetical protein
MLIEIDKDLSNSMKSKNVLRVSTLRMMKAAIKNTEIARISKLSENEMFSVFAKMVKQRKDSAAIYLTGNRKDLSDKELAEVEVIQEYLPKQLSVDEIDNLIMDIIIQNGPTDIGRLMKEIMSLVRGRADGKIVSERVKAAYNHR